MRSDLPTGTVTFLFTDVEGSTKLLHELGAEAYAEALAEHRQVIREAFVSHGGVEVDTQGDAFFVAFPTAPGALEAAQDAREALAQGLIRVRMGLHTGTPYLAEEGYVGDDVHLAARVAASAHGGQIVLSQATRAFLDERFVLSDLGEHRLKDFAEPVWIFQLGADRFPPLKTISNTNLPRPASSFVGREREVEEVVALLRDGARLLTLTGPGGSGKTRLAIEAAAELVPEFKAGVFWVGLAPLRDPALVTDTIAQTLGAKDGLADHIGERELLLLLDNLEQVVDAAPELSSLVEACPNLRLLVTSRELLRVRGEVEYPVLPLAEPEAVGLFCARAGAEPDPTVHELCRALDNLPLALELAAARASVLSPKQILERLSGRLDLLKGGRDADPRQQTLRATIEWSYELLDARGAAPLRPARRLPRRLHARGRRRGRRRRPRHPPVARRQEPPAPHRRALLDAGDDPRVRGRAARGVGRGRGAAAAPRGALPGARRGGGAAPDGQPRGVARPAGARARQPPSRARPARGLRRDTACLAVGRSPVAVLVPEGPLGGRPASSREPAPRRRASDGGPGSSPQRSGRDGGQR